MYKVIIWSVLFFGGCGSTASTNPDLGSKDQGLGEVWIDRDLTRGDGAAEADQGIPPCPRGQGWSVDQGSCQEFFTESLVEEEVSFQNGDQVLRGTVTKPQTDQILSFPAVILIHGSGPNDRDETGEGALGFGFGKEVKPFKDLAEHLAHHGY